MTISPDQNEPDRVPGEKILASTVAPPIQDDQNRQSDTVPTQVVDTKTPAEAPRGRFGILLGMGSMAEWLFGAVSMIVILAVLATIPIVQFLSLGYLLEVCGRVARSGRLRDGFIGIRKAARIGGIVLCTWSLLLPLRLVSSLWQDARLIDPDSVATQNMQITLYVLTALIVAHILWAWFRGGRLRHFLWPVPIRFIKRVTKGSLYAEAREAVWDFVCDLRLPYYFWLGLRGFVGALAWLVLPISLLAVAMVLPSPANGLIGLVGGLMLATGYFTCRSCKHGWRWKAGLPQCSSDAKRRDCLDGLRLRFGSPWLSRWCLHCRCIC